MIGEASCQLYEQVALQQAPGQTLRPGGLALTERALDFCALPAGARVLDIGCGAGATVQYWRDHGYWAAGVDLSALLLQSGRQRAPLLPLIQAEGARLPLADHQVDAILAECSLSALTDAAATLAECYRLLRRGGCLVISDLYARNPAGLAALQALRPVSCLGGVMSQRDVVAQVTQRNFELMLWEDHSELLRDPAGPTALARGALAEFWRGHAGSSMDALDLYLVIARARLGYFLLVAKKV